MKPCGIKSCKTNNKSNPYVSFHSFPTDKVLKSTWIKLIGANNIYPGYRAVCSLHFEDKWFNKTLNRVRLKENAIPTRHLKKEEERCCVPLCMNESDNTVKSQGVTFHPFPEVPALRQYWLHALGLGELSKQEQTELCMKMVCSEHFASEDLHKTTGGYNKLRTGAVPVLLQDTVEDENAAVIEDQEMLQDTEKEEEQVIEEEVLEDTFEMQHNEEPEQMQDTASAEQQEKSETLQMLCRICLETDCKLYPMSKYGLDEVYQNLTGFGMTIDSRLSETCCVECAQRLINYDRLREKSLRADILLTTLLKDNVNSITDQLKKVESNTCELKSSLVKKIFDYDHFDMYIQESNEMDEYGQSYQIVYEEAADEQVKVELPLEKQSSIPNFHCEIIENEVLHETDFSQATYRTPVDYVSSSEDNKTQKTENPTLVNMVSVENVTSSEDNKTTKSTHNIPIDNVTSTENNKIEIKGPNIKITFDENNVQNKYNNESKLNEKKAKQIKNAIIYDAVLDDKFKIVKKEDLAFKVVKKEDLNFKMVKKEDFASEYILGTCQDEMVDEESINDNVVNEEYFEESEDNNSQLGAKYMEVDNDNVQENGSTENQIIKSEDVEHFTDTADGGNDIETTRPDTDNKENYDDDNDNDPNWCNYESPEDNNLSLKKVMSEKIDGRKMRRMRNHPLSALLYHRNLSYTDDLNDIIFTIKKLSFEEQVADLESRLMKNDDSYTCEHCYRSFVEHHAYARHMLKHSSENGPFVCAVCKFCFKTDKLLQRHTVTRHSTKFFCNLCEFSTTYVDPARQHGRRHRGIEYHCPHCPELFIKYTVFIDHIALSHDPEDICRKCGMKFAGADKLEEHKQTKHGTDEEENYEGGPLCDTCDIVFANDAAYRQHLLVSIKHNTDFLIQHMKAKTGQFEEQEKINEIRRRNRGQNRYGPVECEQCGEVLETLGKYHAHFRSLHRDKTRTYYPTMKSKIMCELCGKFFKGHCHYLDHIRAHNNERPYECDLCSRTFGKKHLLKSHRVLHTQRPKLNCHLCEKVFSNRSNLHRHMKCHTGEKRYQCEECGKWYRSNGEKQSHYDHIHLRKPWPKRVRSKRGERMIKQVTEKYISASEEDSAHAQYEVIKMEDGRPMLVSEDDNSQTVIEECVQEIEIDY